MAIMRRIIFLSSDNRKIHVKDFVGKWNLDTNQAIALVKAAIAKLNYQTNNIHMDFQPNIIFAAGDFQKMIPRYFFEWITKMQPTMTCYPKWRRK